MSELEKLVSELNILCDRLDCDYNTNLGGCCYVAYILMKNFESIGVKTSLIVESDEGEVENDSLINKVQNRDHVNCKGLGRQTCYHYFVNVPELGYVNQGEPCGELSEIDGLVSKDLKWIYKTGSWNDEYETRNNAMVGRKIKQVFDKYEDLYKERRDSRSK